MADFERAVKFLLDNEGDYSNVPGDRGGATKFGITEAKAAEYGFDVRDVTLERAKQIYLQEYWPPFYKLWSQRVATKMLDLAANFGVHGATVVLQKAINSVSPEKLKLDGVVGPKTEHAANGIGEELLLSLIANEACRRHVMIAADTSQLKFLRGWILRDLRIPMEDV